VIRNRVTFFLSAVAALALAAFPFVAFAPNRILSGASVSLWSAVPAYAIAVVVAALALMLGGCAWNERRIGEAMTLAGAALLLLADFIAAGAAAQNLMATASSPAARVSLGSAFWIVLVAAGLAISESLRRLSADLWVQLLFTATLLAMLALLATDGWFADLSIVREFTVRRGEYGTALAQHILLVAAPLAAALIIGVPLGVRAAQRPKSANRIFGVLSLIQTIPSIALFGLLIGPLSMLGSSVPLLGALGIHGIGFAPALIALTLYGLLPVARNVEAGLKSVPDSAIDAARGMGMTRRQRLTQVALPLALPVLLAGLRIVTVQLIGLAVVAALIGAGGFGTFVFIGLGQTATDLVLLGALSAILLALVADGLLRLLADAATRRAAS
jgi:osmoprotectant transport system permease protein